MGCGVSHGAFMAAYSAFYRWRLKVAEVAGMEMAPADQGSIYRDDLWPGCWRQEWPADRFCGEWPPGEPNDPLLVLLVHSDCDGYIEHRHLWPLICRLVDDVLPNMDDGGQGHIAARGGYRAVTERFICGLMEADRLGDNVSVA